APRACRSSMLVHPQFDPVAFTIGPLTLGSLTIALPVRWYGLMYLAGFALFYKPLYYLAHPLEIFALWQGGMSFHGGFLGVLIALWLFGRRRHKRWLEVTDFVAPLCPLGLAAGRLGNFINGELWGRPTNLPWAMVFPQVDTVPRHPSQLYEFGLEGIALFALLWIYARRRRPVGAVSGLFLIGYGSLRFVVEYA